MLATLSWMPPIPCTRAAFTDAVQMMSYEARKWSATDTSASRGHCWNQSTVQPLMRPGNLWARTLNFSPTWDKEQFRCHSSLPATWRRHSSCATVLCQQPGEDTVHVPQYSASNLARTQFMSHSSLPATWRRHSSCDTILCEQPDGGTVHCEPSLPVNRHCHWSLPRFSAKFHCNGSLQRCGATITVTIHCHCTLPQYTATVHCHSTRPQCTAAVSLFDRLAVCNVMVNFLIHCMACIYSHTHCLYSREFGS